MGRHQKNPMGNITALWWRLCHCWRFYHFRFIGNGCIIFFRHSRLVNHHHYIYSKHLYYVCYRNNIKYGNYHSYHAIARGNSKHVEYRPVIINVSGNNIGKLCLYDAYSNSSSSNCFQQRIYSYTHHEQNRIFHQYYQCIGYNGLHLFNHLIF